jgi:hypothetical protein
MIGLSVVVRALGMLVWQGRRRARRARPGPTATRLVRAVVVTAARAHERCKEYGARGWHIYSKECTNCGDRTGIELRETVTGEG